MSKINRIAAMMMLCVVAFIANINFGFAAQGGSGLQVSPTRAEMSILPGEQKDFKISVKNVTQGPIKVKSYVNDFQSDGVTGNPIPKIDLTEKLPNSVRNFVKGLQDFSLNAGETKEVKLTVDVPPDASPGGYYGLIRFAAVPQGVEGSNAETQVTLNANVAPILFVNVAGDVTQQIQIDSIKIFRDKRSSALFLFEPNKVAIGISNKGNGFSKPFGKISIQKGGKEVFSYELNNKDPRGTVLPNTSRTFTDDIKNVNKFGKYTVQANVAYGQGGEVIVQKASFWFIPIWMVGVAIGLIIVLAIIIWIVYRRLGRKRRRR